MKTSPQCLARRIACVAAVVAAAAGSAVAVAAPTWSGPSVAKPSAKVTMKGGGFAANAALSVVVIDPSGRESHISVTANASGRLNYTFRPAIAGMHQIKVLDSGGRALQGTVVNVIE